MSRRLYWRIWRFILRILFALFVVERRIVGAERLASIDGPFLLACNHISNLDPPLLLVMLPRQVNFMAKKGLFQVPVLGWCMRKSGEISLNRGVPDSASIRTALARFAEGLGVCVFPEGTRSEDGRLRPAKPGVGMLAMRARVPVVPAAITGSDAILPKGKFVPRVAEVTIRVGEPVALDDLYARTPGSREEEREIYREIARRVTAAIAGLLGVEPPEPPTPEFREDGNDAVEGEPDSTPPLA